LEREKNPKVSATSCVSSEDPLGCAAPPTPSARLVAQAPARLA
jgi:hypothetical protein